MDYFPLVMLVSVCLLIAIHYLFEVHAGSALSMYDAESGVVSAGGAPEKTTPGEFLGGVAPLQLAALGLPLVIDDLLSGVLLMLSSLLLFCLYRKQSPARQ